VRSGDLRNKEKIQEDEVGEQWSEMDVGFYKKIKNKKRERESGRPCALAASAKRKE
jgi:hypothetical protein